MATAPDNFQATADGIDIIFQWTNTDTYSKIWVQYSKGAGWVTETDALSGHEESYTLESVTANTQYKGRVAGYDIFLEAWSDWSNIDVAICFSDSVAETITITDSLYRDEAITGDSLIETITITDSISEVLDYVDALTESITVTDTAYESQSISTDYSHYLLSETGEVYEYGKDYSTLAGRPMASTWISKETDFSDANILSRINGQIFEIQPQQYSDFKNGLGTGNSVLDSLWERDGIDEQLEQDFQTYKSLSGKFKYVEKLRLNYIDRQADATVNVGLSTDGGEAWLSSTKTLGIGDNRSKIKDFFLRKTGHEFTFKLESPSKIQWSSLDVFFRPSGRYLSLAPQEEIVATEDLLPTNDNEGSVGTPYYRWGQGQFYTLGAINGINLYDTDKSSYLNVKWNEDDLLARTLNLKVNSGDRTIDLSGNLTIESASLINQDLTTDADGTLNDLTLTAPSNIYALSHDSFADTHNLTTDIDHNSLTSAHNLTTDIDHDSLTNTHDLTTDIDHDTITNGHNLTTDINHNSLTNYAANQHVVLPNTIANVLGDHDLAAHTALGLAPTTTKLDDWGTPDNNTDLNASTSAHGLCPQLSNSSSEYLDGTGAWSAPTVVPSGAIILWEDSDTCPTGYTKVTAFGGRFPLGCTTGAGTDGGTSSGHRHSVNPAEKNTGYNDTFFNVDHGSDEGAAVDGHTHPFDQALCYTSYEPNSQAEYPPWRKVLFCKKD